jgi:hypothetical protein
MSPKSSRNVELMNTMTEMCENRLNMLQDSDVIISSSISVIVLQFVDNLK